MSNSKRSGFAVVKASEFKGENSQADKNGNNPVYLHPVSGVIPNRNVLSGTVADNQGFIPGETYLAQWTKGAIDPEYGQRIDWTVVKELDAMSLIDVISGSMFNGEAGEIFELTAVKTEATSEAKTSKKKAEAQGG